MIAVVLGYGSTPSHSTSCAKLPRSAPETLARVLRGYVRAEQQRTGTWDGWGRRGQEGGGQTGADLGAGLLTHPEPLSQPTCNSARSSSLSQRRRHPRRNHLRGVTQMVTPASPRPPTPTPAPSPALATRSLSLSRPLCRLA